MPSVRVPVAPALLIWARKTIGYDLPDAARRIGIADERLARFEAGEVQPTVRQLQTLARVYGRPLAVFFLHEPPAGVDVMRDFRRLPEAEREWSPDLHKLFRRIREQQEIAADLREDEGEGTFPPLPLVDVIANPEQAAADARTALGVDLASQYAWPGPPQALAAWIAAVESLGILVFQASDVPVNEMRGFSLTDGRVPVIFINGQDFDRGRIFTLAHELGHLLLHQGGLCDLLDGAPESPNEAAVEIACNRFAAALLMPRDAFVREPQVSSAAGPQEWSDHDLALLSARYKTSSEAVLRMLVTVGLATKEHYEARREEFLGLYEEAREERRRRQRLRESGGGPPVAVMAVRDLGRPYVRLVLDAYSRRAITASTVSDFLGVRLKHLERITERVGS